MPYIAMGFRPSLAAQRYTGSEIAWMLVAAEVDHHRSLQPNTDVGERSATPRLRGDLVRPAFRDVQELAISTSRMVEASARARRFLAAVESAHRHLRAPFAAAAVSGSRSALTRK